MERISAIKKLSDNRYLNLYELDATFRDGNRAPYYVASRRKNVDTIKAATHDNRADGVILYGVYGENKDKVVLIRQYRYPVDGYVYEFPAGLVEPDEDMLEAGIREMFEETGLAFTPVQTARPFYTSVGMTDGCLSLATPSRCRSMTTSILGFSSRTCVIRCLATL